MKKWAAIAALFTAAVPQLGYATEISYETANGSDEELQVVEKLRDLRSVNDLAKWEFTDRVLIDENSRPHSHPVLTLHTRHGIKTSPDRLLSVYLHEQIHWFFVEKEDATNAAIEDLKELFPDAPTEFPEGAGSEFSTYLHILVCFAEIEALSELLSEQRVGETLDFWQGDHYTWVYQVIEDRHDQIDAILVKHGLKI